MPPTSAPADPYDLRVNRTAGSGVDDGVTSAPGPGRAVRAAIAVLALALVPLAADAALRTRDGSHHSISTADPVPADDTQAISYHGIEMRVPASWKVNDTYCGTPMHDTVVVAQGPTPDCLVREPPGLTVVEILTTSTEPDSFGAIYSTVATESVTVDGSPAQRGSGYITRIQARRSVLVLPEQEVVVSIESPDDAMAERLLDSVHLAPVDSNGCAARVSSLTPDRGAKPAYAAAALLPPGATSVSICRYRDLQLERSTRLTANDVAQLQSIFGALPVGVSHPGPEFAEAPFLCAEDLRRGFVIRADSPDGDITPVFVHIGGCDELSASNGARSTKIDWPLVTFMTRHVGYDFSFPDPRTLR
jgi:hypothetical protein